MKPFYGGSGSGIDEKSYPIVVGSRICKNNSVCVIDGNNVCQIEVGLIEM